MPVVEERKGNDEVRRPINSSVLAPAEETKQDNDTLNQAYMQQHANTDRNLMGPALLTSASG